MAERDNLVETLKTQEEKHKIAFQILCKDKENSIKELEERTRKIGAEMEEKVKEITKEKDILGENIKKEKSVMQAEMKEIRNQLLHRNSENAKLHAKFNTMTEMVKKYKAFHEEMNSALQNVT